MLKTDIDLFRSVRVEQFPDGAIVDDKAVPEILYPDFEPRLQSNGRMRGADVVLSSDKEWVHSGGGTSLFDRDKVFKGNSWFTFPIPEGTVIPESLVIRFTGYNSRFQANHYQIESRANLMQVNAYKGALDNLARNAVARAIELSKPRK